MHYYPSEKIRSWWTPNDLSQKCWNSSKAPQIYYHTRETIKKATWKTNWFSAKIEYRCNLRIAILNPDYPVTNWQSAQIQYVLCTTVINWPVREGMSPSAAILGCVLLTNIFFWISNKGLRQLNLQLLKMGT